MSTLLIRADASPSTGTGHIMRCLALAQAWQASAQGSSVVFVTAESLPGLDTRLDDEGMLIERLSCVSGSVSDALDTARLARAYEAEWIVADSYAFGAEYQRSLKREGVRLLLVDDYRHATHYFCDLLLNQNISAQKDWYVVREPYTRLLLGTQYALLRREFWTWGSWKRDVSSVATRILVTMGGADPAGTSGRVLEALELLNHVDLQIELVIGFANRHWDTLARRARESHLDVKLINPTTSMPEIMARSNIAVSAAGGTLRELLFMQMPTIAVSVAENQRLAARSLGEIGAILSFELESLSPAGLAHSIQQLICSDSTRSEMATAGRKLVDGQGASRVIDAMTANHELSMPETQMRLSAPTGMSKRC